MTSVLFFFLFEKLRKIFFLYSMIKKTTLNFSMLFYHYLSSTKWIKLILKKKNLLESRWLFTIVIGQKILKFRFIILRFYCQLTNYSKTYSTPQDEAWKAVQFIYDHLVFVAFFCSQNEKYTEWWKSEVAKAESFLSEVVFLLRILPSNIFSL